MFTGDILQVFKSDLWAGYLEVKSNEHFGKVSVIMRMVQLPCFAAARCGPFYGLFAIHTVCFWKCDIQM